MILKSCIKLPPFRSFNLEVYIQRVICIVSKTVYSTYHISLVKNKECMEMNLRNPGHAVVFYSDSFLPNFIQVNSAPYLLHPH